MTDIVKLLEELIAIPSMNPMGSGRTGPEYSEGSVADFLASVLSRNGIDCETYEVMPGRKNLIGFVNAGAAKTLMLEAHLDTVPADNMEIEPFKPVLKNGRVYGRGSCDTKASLAVFFGTAANMSIRHRDLKYNLMLLGTCDEEYGFTGARAAVERGLKADFAIVGEPTQLRIVRAHKGVMRWKIKANGQAAHSAYPELGDNAIYTMAKALNRIEEYASRLRKGVPDEFLGAPSLSVGVISGGHTVNIVPDSCWIEVDRRVLPGESRDSVLDSIRSLLADMPNVVVEDPYLSLPAMSVDPGSEIVDVLSSAIREVRGEPISEGANYATDAGVFNDAKLPTVVFGPGDIKDAHTSTESVDLSQVESATRILERLLF